MVLKEGQGMRGRKRKSMGREVEEREGKGKRDEPWRGEGLVYSPSQAAARRFHQAGLRHRVYVLVHTIKPKSKLKDSRWAEWWCAVASDPCGLALELVGCEKGRCDWVKITLSTAFSTYLTLLADA